MVNPSYLDSIGNSFGAVVIEVFSGTDENQKAKLKRMLDSFTQISLWNSTIHKDIESAKKMRLSVIHNILPSEMMEKILRLLKFEDICKAQLICRRWNEIIVKGNLLKKVSGNKKLFQIKAIAMNVQRLFSILIFSKNFLYNCCWRKWEFICWSLKWKPKN